MPDDAVLKWKYFVSRFLLISFWLFKDCYAEGTRRLSFRWPNLISNKAISNDIESDMQLFEPKKGWLRFAPSDAALLPTKNRWNLYVNDTCCLMMFVHGVVVTRRAQCSLEPCRSTSAADVTADDFFSNNRNPSNSVDRKLNIVCRVLLRDERCCRFYFEGKMRHMPCLWMPSK